MASKLVHSSQPISGYYLKCYVDYSYTQNISANTSTITCGFRITLTSGLTIGAWTDVGGSYVGTSSLKFNGSIPQISSNRTLASGKKFTVKHNADGSATANIKWKWGVNSSWGGVVKPSGSFNITLPRIPRSAKATDATNFNDEENPTVYYSNPAGNAVDKLETCLSWTNNTDIPWRPIPKTGTSYKYNLSTEERNLIRSVMANKVSMPIKFFVKTTIGSKAYYSSVSRTVTIVNAEPTISPVVYDTNPTTIALTGDKNTLIGGFSTAYCAMNPSTKKGASATEYIISSGAYSSTSSSATFPKIAIGSVNFTLKDSRGKYATTTVKKNFIYYNKITCRQAIDIDVSGNGTLTISGKCFSGSFGAKQNTVKVQYRYKKYNGEYGAWQTATASLSDNTYTAVVELPKFDYKERYVFQSWAGDALTSAYSSEDIAKALPVFDWGKKDFNFNVPITVMGKPLADLIYPVGTVYGTTDARFKPDSVFGGRWYHLMSDYGVDYWERVG